MIRDLAGVDSTGDFADELWVVGQVVDAFGLVEQGRTRGSPEASECFGGDDDADWDFHFTFLSRTGICLDPRQEGWWNFHLGQC